MELSEKFTRPHSPRTEKIMHSKKYPKSKSKIITWWLKSATKFKSLNVCNTQTSSSSTIILMIKTISFWFSNWQKEANFTANWCEMVVLMKIKPKEWHDKSYLQWSICIKIKSFTGTLNHKIFCSIRKITSNSPVPFC